MPALAGKHLQFLQETLPGLNRIAVLWDDRISGPHLRAQMPEPEERKAIVRSFLAGIRVDRAAGRAVLRWYRLPQTAWVKKDGGGGRN